MRQLIISVSFQHWTVQLIHLLLLYIVGFFWFCCQFLAVAWSLSGFPLLSKTASSFLIMLQNSTMWKGVLYHPDCLLNLNSYNTMKHLKYILKMVAVHQRQHNTGADRLPIAWDKENWNWQDTPAEWMKTASQHTPCFPIGICRPKPHFKDMSVKRSFERKHTNTRRQDAGLGGV